MDKELSSAFKAKDKVKLTPEFLLPGTHCWCWLSQAQLGKARGHNTDTRRLGKQKGNLKVTQEK